MIAKEAGDRTQDIKLLEEILALGGPKKKAIEIELRNVRAGIKAEKDAAYLIDFHYGKSANFAVIHDLRLEIEGRTAQIDHLLIHRTMHVIVFETKSFHAGVKINEDGEFLRWNDWKKTYEGMPSPLAQNDRHILVLEGAMKQLALPTRLGVRMEPTFHSLVLVSPNARIDRPRTFDTSRVIKADTLDKTVTKTLEAQNLVGAIARLIGADTLEAFAKDVARLHRPLQIDYAARFGICEKRASPSFASSKPSPAAVAAASVAPVTESTFKCRHCDSKAVAVHYGKYGYYFKCADCAGNTPIKLRCDQSHSERVRKEGLRFFRECGACETSHVFFENAI